MNDHDKHQAHGHGHDHAAAHGRGEADVHKGHACCHGTPDAAEQKATDPVCGMKVDPQAAAGSHEHAGTRYYFCSTHCLAKFEAAPQKYLATVPSASPEPAVHGAQYTCP